MFYDPSVWVHPLDGGLDIALEKPKMFRHLKCSTEEENLFWLQIELFLFRKFKIVLNKIPNVLMKINNVPRNIFKCSVFCYELF